MGRRPTVVALGATLGAALAVPLLMLGGISTVHAAARHPQAAWRMPYPSEAGPDAPVASASGAQAASGAPTPDRSAQAAPAPASGTPNSTDASQPATSATRATAPRGNGLQLSTTTTADGSVALTFDDGPGPQTAQMLDLLAQYHIRATFCLVGQNVRAHHDLVARMVAEGHTLCNHTWKHDERLGTRSIEAIRTDLQATSDEIHKAAPGAPIRYFRHPGGNFTPTAVEVGRRMGMIPLGWNVDPRDWDTAHRRPGPALTDHIVTTVRAGARPGAIVLSHDAGGDRSSTIAAYRLLLPELQRTCTLAALPTS